LTISAIGNGMVGNLLLIGRRIVAAAVHESLERALSYVKKIKVFVVVVNCCGTNQDDRSSRLAQIVTSGQIDDAG